MVGVLVATRDRWVGEAASESEEGGDVNISRKGLNSSNRCPGEIPYSSRTVTATERTRRGTKRAKQTPDAFPELYSSSIRRWIAGTLRFLLVLLLRRVSATYD